MTKHIYFFRHGETQANVEQRLMGGRLDSSLTERGIRQAQALAEALKTLELDVFFVSSNTRAQETARILIGSRTVPLVVTEALKEQDFGLITGKLMNEIPASVDAAYIQDPYYFHHVEGESLDDVKMRAGAFMEQIMSQEYQHIAIVTHENVIKAAIAYMKGFDREAVIMRIPYCSMTHYTRDHNKQYHAIAVARTY